MIFFYFSTIYFIFKTTQYQINLHYITIQSNQSVMTLPPSITTYAHISKLVYYTDYLRHLDSLYIRPDSLVLILLLFN